MLQYYFKRLNLFLCILIISAIYLYNNNNNKLKTEISTSKCNAYKKECIRLFKKLRFPNKTLIIRPPLHMPPKYLLDEFTQNGEMPITKEFYFNEVYSDADSASSNTFKQDLIRKEEFISLLNRVKAHSTLHYDNTEMQAIMKKYIKIIENKSILIMGTQIPWIEAISYEYLASKITTLDYTRKMYEQFDDSNNRLEWFHVNDYLDDLILNSKIELFDNSASFSSIEHSGLGRYGDPLAPNGDIEAVKQVHCLLKPESLFFLGLPTSNNDQSFIEFNAHRVYGSKRLNKLFVGWNLIDQVKCLDLTHTIYVLQKKTIC